MTTDAKPMTTLPGEIAEALGRYRGSVAGAALYECATNAAVERDDRDALVAAILAYGASALARAEAAERERDEARAERDEARRDFDAVVDERNAMTAAAESLRERVRELEEGLRVLVSRLDAVHAHPAYQSVWAVSQLRVGPYRGPTYVDALAAARALLAPPKETTPDARTGNGEGR